MNLATAAVWSLWMVWCPVEEGCCIVWSEPTTRSACYRRLEDVVRAVEPDGAKSVRQAFCARMGETL